MVELEAIDIFIETDPEAEGDDGPALISVRGPADREFSRQIKELGAKWDDQSKEWRLFGNQELVTQVAELCKKIFPKLARRRNRLIAARLSTYQSKSSTSEEKDQSIQLELVAELEFVVNRTIRNYRLGQNLKWTKEFRQIIELDGDNKADSTSEELQSKFARELIKKTLPELERAATSAFENLLVGRKEAVKAILNEVGIVAN